MLSKNINFEFVGFDPEYETRSVIDSVAERMSSLAPSDSFVKVAMKKGKNTVRASCRIASKAGEFVAETVCSSPVVAIQQIESRILQQLDEWKQRRFLQRQRQARAPRSHLQVAVSGC